MKRQVSSYLDLDVLMSTQLELQIAVAEMPGTTLVETLLVTLDGWPIPCKEVTGEAGTRIHLVSAEPGKVIVTYEATLEGTAEPARVSDYELALYNRPSRYADSDQMSATAAAYFGELTEPADLLAAVSSWVGTQLSYVPGSSNTTTGAAETLLARRGVCRDYAHLVVALLRARNVPSRVVAVYAPGCDPMDFHAVVEAHVNGSWRVVDATALAPRSSLIRIATGRDAADIAFLSNHGGAIAFNYSQVFAIVDGMLPSDDITELVSLT